MVKFQLRTLFGSKIIEFFPRLPEAETQISGQNPVKWQKIESALNWSKIDIFS